MTYKNGIYLSVDGDNAVRVIVENSAKVQTERIKISDELIGELEFNMSTYETAVEYISEKTEPLDELGITYSEEQFSVIVNAALEVADGVKENDLSAGVLLRAAINNILDVPDNGTAMYWLETKLTRKLQQWNDSLLEEYERAKNKNYKRVERYENSDGSEKVLRLTFDEYRDWLDNASRMKSLYLQGKISAEEFGEFIRTEKCFQRMA